MLTASCAGRSEQQCELVYPQATGKATVINSHVIKFFVLVASVYLGTLESMLLQGDFACQGGGKFLLLHKGLLLVA